MLTTPNFRFSPHEWANPHPCIDTGFVVQNDFTLANRWEDHVHKLPIDIIIVQDDKYRPERFHTCEQVFAPISKDTIEDGSST